MKKNIAMRVAAILFILTMISTCAFSTTFAKYVTSDSADDSARVAKWGVVVEVTGDEAFATKYNNEADPAGVKVVSASETQKVLAPGTSGKLTTLDITGIPEVMVNVIVEVNLSLTGWKVDVDGDTDDDPIEYCPLVFTIGSTEYKIDPSNPTMDSIGELESAIENAYEAATKTNFAANQSLATQIYTSWRWDFAGDDVKDTALGNWDLNGKAEPKISMSLSVTVEQVD